MRHGEDFIVESSLTDLVAAMNRLAKERDGPQLDVEDVRQEIHLRDIQVENEYSKDAQIMLIRNARNFSPEKRARVAKPHKILDPKQGPLFAVRLNLLTRKSLGGLQTDLDSNVLRPDGSPFPNLYAAGEVAGFGGGGVHGYSALEGTFLGGCIFSGRAAGLKIAERMG
jgi:predicted oxidoreductase